MKTLSTKNIIEALTTMADSDDGLVELVEALRYQGIRGCTSLEDFEKALEPLVEAWNVGYRFGARVRQ